MTIRTPYSDHLHATKYRGANETHREAMNRVSAALTSSINDSGYHVFKEILRTMRFLPAGRIQSAVGASKQVTAFNCFVAGTIADSYVAGHGSIMERAKEAATTMRMGGGVGYDFSTLRPRGAMIKKLQSHSSGPIAFMEIFDAVCRATCSSGHRRGAQMGVLRVDHPDIEEFVRAKHKICNGCDNCEGCKHQYLSGFNLSIGVTDEFMEAVDKGGEFTLRHENTEYRTIDARTLFELVMRSTWDKAEPGILFLDTINQMNNLFYCETIASTNPCAEQPLPPHGACLLGSFNLARYLVGGARGWKFDYEQLGVDIPHVVRAMDNVTDVSNYPLWEQEQEAKNKRRMGLGVTGLANAGEALGNPYGSDGFLKFQRTVMTIIRNGVYRASAMLAKEKGSFPLYDRDEFLSGGFIQTLPESVRDLIAEHGIRNSHLLSVAPTGTISMTADNISSGCEPVVAHRYKRLVNMPEGQVEVELEDYGVKFLDTAGKTIADVTVDEHISVLEIAAELVDSAVSKTINMPATTTWNEFKDVYMQCWRKGIKACSTYRHGGDREGIIKIESDDAERDAAVACTLDEFGRKDCS